MLTRNQKIFNELKESAKRIPVGCVVKYPDIYENIESYKRINVNCVSTTLNFKLNGAREGELKDEVIRLAREIQKIYNDKVTKYWCKDYEYATFACDISDVMNEIDRWREIKKEIYSNPLWYEDVYCPMDGEKLLEDHSWDNFGFRNYCPKCTYDYCIAGG